MTQVMRRRQVARILALGGGASALWGCVKGSEGAVALATAQVWATGLANALSAAALAYSGPNKTQVSDIASKLNIAAQDFANLGDVSTAKNTALSLLSFAQQLSPMVAQYVGNAGPYVPVAIGVLQAFVLNIPAPVTTPAQVPKELSAKQTV